MRQFIVGALAGAILLTTGCNKSNQDNSAGSAVERAAAAADYYTVRAGPVPNAQITALAGTFQLLKASAANGIPSDRLGGGCLIFAAADLGYTKMAAMQCHQNADCYTGEGESAGYCDGQTHSCWAKPGNVPDEALCNKHIILNVNELTPAPKSPFDASKVVKAGAKVRVDACLNKAGADPGATGCGSKDGADRIEVMGPVATVK